MSNNVADQMVEMEISLDPRLQETLEKIASEKGIGIEDLIVGCLERGYAEAEASPLSMKTETKSLRRLNLEADLGLEEDDIHPIIELCRLTDKATGDLLEHCQDGIHFDDFDEAERMEFFSMIDFSLGNLQNARANFYQRASEIEKTVESV